MSTGPDESESQSSRCPSTNIDDEETGPIPVQDDDMASVLQTLHNTRDQRLQHLIVKLADFLPAIPLERWDRLLTTGFSTIILEIASDSFYYTLPDDLSSPSDPEEFDLEVCRFIPIGVGSELIEPARHSFIPSV